MKYLKIYENFITDLFNKKSKDSSVKFAIHDYVRRKKDGKIGQIKIVGINSTPDKHNYIIAFGNSFDDLHFYYAKELDKLDNLGNLKIGDIITKEELEMYNNANKYNL